MSALSPHNKEAIVSPHADNDDDPQACGVVHKDALLGEDHAGEKRRHHNHHHHEDLSDGTSPIPFHAGELLANLSPQDQHSVASDQAQRQQHDDSQLNQSGRKLPYTSSLESTWSTDEPYHGGPSYGGGYSLFPPSIMDSHQHHQHGYYHHDPPNPVYLHAHHPQPSTSFDSSHHHASFSAAAHPPPPPYLLGGGPPIMTTTYSYGPTPPSHAPPHMIAYPPHYYHHHPVWSLAAAPPPRPIEYISDVQPTDVLCGRGGATNSHSGNRAFRLLVKQHQESYLRAKKRDKPGVASKVVDLIRKRGGRFLRRSDHVVMNGGGHDSGGGGGVLWVDIGEERAREKTCQALREGAPAWRRRRKRKSSGRGEGGGDAMKRVRTTTTTSEDEDEGEDDDYDDFSFSATSSPSFDHSPSSGGKERGRRESRRHRRRVELEDSEDDARDDTEGNDDATTTTRWVRPIPKLIKGEARNVPLDQLTCEQQELYKSFQPPRPAAMRKGRGGEKYITVGLYRSADSESESNEPWTVEEV